MFYPTYPYQRESPMTQETTAASTIARLESRLKALQHNALFTRDRDRLAETDALLAALPHSSAWRVTRTPGGG